MQGTLYNKHTLLHRNSTSNNAMTDEQHIPTLMRLSGRNEMAGNEEGWNQRGCECVCVGGGGVHAAIFSNVFGVRCLPVFVLL